MRSGSPRTTRGTSSGSPGRCSTRSKQGSSRCPAGTLSPAGKRREAKAQRRPSPGKRAARGQSAAGAEPGDTTWQRFAVARQIADLFDRYATTRPEILRQWQRGVRGDGTMRAAGVGGATAADDEQLVGALPASMRWQFELWGQVRRRIGCPAPAELLPARIEALRRGDVDPALPAGVEVFGVSALTRPQLSVLAALGHVRDVHVSLLHPSAVAWSRTAPIEPVAATVRSRHGETEIPADSHPLLQSWGRQSSETAALVRGLPAPVAVETTSGASPTAPSTLLAHLQTDLLADRPPTPFARSTSDASVQVHACHGTIRQLEVLRDALGHLFVADASLRPDDVLVICPDLGRFEPFVAPVFGRGTLPIPVTVSDLSLGTENPVASALATILHTIAGRCTATDVLAIAALDPVRRRLGISADDLDRFANWSRRLGTSWGLDSEHRHAWLDADIALGTWDQAVRSLLLGIAMPAPAPRVGFGGIVPFDDVGGDDVVGAGRLAELVARLRRARRLADGRRPIHEWCAVLVEILAQLCAAPVAERWQTASVLEAIDDVRRSAVVAGATSSTPLAFDDVIAVVDNAIVHRRGRLRLRTGRVAVTANAPVRNVPAKVVCVLGCDEASLPRAGIDGDDLLAVRPCVGERDRHAERRHLLLDALLAAEQTLIITCDGSDVTTNRQIRFAVQLTELLDVVDATLEPTGSGAGRDSAVLTRHPLHAYDERNFDLAGVTAAGIFSFDDVMCRAADARRHRVDVAGAGSWRRFAVAAPVPEDVTLAQLCDACVCPARTLLRDGLGVRLPGEVERVDHAIPLSVDKLQAAFIGRRLLERYGRHAGALRVDGATADGWEAAARAAVEEWAEAERLAGGRPPGRLIDDSLSSVAAEIDAIAVAAECSGLDRVAILGADGVVDVDLELKVSGALTGRRAGTPDCLRLVDRVVGIDGDVLCRLAYRRPKPRTIIAAVLDLAAVVATTGDSAWRALTVTRGASRGSGGAECHLIRVIAADPQAAAYALLRTAAELRVAALVGRRAGVRADDEDAVREEPRRRGRARRQRLPHRRPLGRGQPVRLG